MTKSKRVRITKIKDDFDWLGIAGNRRREFIKHLDSMIAIRRADIKETITKLPEWEYAYVDVPLPIEIIIMRDILAYMLGQLRDELTNAMAMEVEDKVNWVCNLSLFWSQAPSDFDKNMALRTLLWPLVMDFLVKQDYPAVIQNSVGQRREVAILQSASHALTLVQKIYRSVYNTIYSTIPNRRRYYT